MTTILEVPEKHKQLLQPLFDTLHETTTELQKAQLYSYTGSLYFEAEDKEGNRHEVYLPLGKDLYYDRFTLSANCAADAYYMADAAAHYEWPHYIHVDVTETLITITQKWNGEYASAEQKTLIPLHNYLKVVQK